MFDTYLERITNEAYYNNQVDDRILENIEELDEKIKAIEKKIEDTKFLYETLCDGFNENFENDIEELQEELEELQDEKKEYEGIAYGCQ